MAQIVEMVRGTSKTLAITLTDANNDLYTLTEGEVVVFGVKKKPDDDTLLIKKTVTEGENGIYTVSIAPTDTAELPYGKYLYDVGLQSGGAYHSIIEPNPFIIQPNVTKWGDGS